MNKMTRRMKGWIEKIQRRKKGRGWLMICLIETGIEVQLYTLPNHFINIQQNPPFQHHFLDYPSLFSSVNLPPSFLKSSVLLKQIDENQLCPGTFCRPLYPKVARQEQLCPSLLQPKRSFSPHSLILSTEESSSKSITLSFHCLLSRSRLGCTSEADR